MKCFAKSSAKIYRQSDGSSARAVEAVVEDGLVTLRTASFEEYQAGYGPLSLPAIRISFEALRELVRDIAKDIDSAKAV
jgi:hypothetical protein